MENKLSVGLGYSPWLRNLVPDMGLAYLAAAYKINDRSSVAATLRYFNAGNIDFRDQYNHSLGQYNPNEWAVDATYSRMLGDYLSGAVAGRFIYSNLIQNQLVSFTTPIKPTMPVLVFQWLLMSLFTISVLWNGSAAWMPTLCGVSTLITLVVR